MKHMTSITVFKQVDGTWGYCPTAALANPAIGQAMRYSDELGFPTAKHACDAIKRDRSIPKGAELIIEGAKTWFQQGVMERCIVAPSSIDPRHIEGYVRLQHSTLGHLDWTTIRREVRIALACIQEAGTEAAERNAKSFGL